MDLNLPEPTFKEQSLSQIIVVFKNNIEARRVRVDIRRISETLDEEVLSSLAPEEKQIILFVSEHGRITTKECTSLIRKKKLTALRRLKALVNKRMLQGNLPNSSKSNYTLGIKFIKRKEETPTIKEDTSQGSLFPK